MAAHADLVYRRARADREPVESLRSVNPLDNSELKRFPMTHHRETLQENTP
jgi:hypothetical protein